VDVGISVGERVFVGDGVSVSVGWGVSVGVNVYLAVEVVNGLTPQAEIENKNSGNRSNIAIFRFGCMNFKSPTMPFPGTAAGVGWLLLCRTLCSFSQANNHNADNNT